MTYSRRHCASIAPSNSSHFANTVIITHSTTPQN
nr:MAG TPA: hypothetical protein [Bacteriophage sp.]